MHGQKVKAEARDVGRRAFDRVGDVQQLEIKEYRASGGLQALCELEAAAEQKLQADPVAIDGVA